MLNIYWKSGGQTRTLMEKKFASEAEFERYIFENQDILGDDFSIIYRQIRTGNRQGIPDMLGVDQDARVCLFELKNVEATEDVLPQALQYAIWAETNPDSIKAIWLESKTRPENIQMDWDSLDVRVIIIAPSFREAVYNMAGKIGYQVDLVQVKRYCLDDNEFVLVDQFERKAERKPTQTTAKGEWDWSYYESEHGKEATGQFRRAFEAVEAVVKKHGWDVPYNLNKGYIGFKLGNRVLFSVSWGGAYAWKVKVKVPAQEAQSFKGKDWVFQAYDDTFHEAVFKPLNPTSPDVSEMEPYFVAAYERVSGSK